MAAPVQTGKAYKTSLGGTENAWRTGNCGSLEQFVKSLESLKIVNSKLVGEAMRAVDRACFVRDVSEAYVDSPQAIGYNATISAPHMHAWCLRMFEDQMKEDMSVLDVGSGSGYLTTCMAWMLRRQYPQKPGHVYGIDIVPELVEYGEECTTQAYSDLMASNGGTISYSLANGWEGLPDRAPFHFIHVGAAAQTLPQTLVDQLAPDGKMVIPLHTTAKGHDQALYLITKPSAGSSDDKPTVEYLMGVRYVPLVKKL